MNFEMVHNFEIYGFAIIGKRKSISHEIYYYICQGMFTDQKKYLSGYVYFVELL